MNVRKLKIHPLNWIILAVVFRSYFETLKVLRMEIFRSFCDGQMTRETMERQLAEEKAEIKLKLTGDSFQSFQSFPDQFTDNFWQQIFEPLLSFAES